MTGLAPDTKAFNPPQGEPGWLTELRRAALARFAELGLPTRRQEARRSTNLRPLERTAFPPAAPGAGPADAALADYGGDDRNYRLVLANGRRHSLRIGEAVGGRPRFVLGATAMLFGSLTESHFGLGEAQGGQPLVALNAALFTDGFALVVPDGIAVDRPIEILHWGDSDAPAAIHTRNVVRLGKGSSATVIESFAGRGSYWTNDVTRVALAEGASLRHVRLQDESQEAIHTATTRVALAGAATYESFTLTLGGLMSRADIAVALDGEAAVCGVNGAYLLRGSQEATIATLIDHAAPASTTREVFKGVVDDHAHGVFQGKIQVRQAAQKTNAHQLNKNLLLSPRAAVDTKPELEIFADDVKCSHGATVGDLDETALFYLVSRGLPEAEARRMLIEAFAADAIDLVRDEDSRAYLRRHLARWLAHHRK